MWVEVVVDNFALPIGTQKNVQEKFAKQLIEQGILKEITEADIKKFEPKEDEETIVENEVVEEVEAQETSTETKPTKKAKK